MEYNKIIDRLASYASSPLGKEMCMKLVQVSEYDEIEQAQLNTEDAFNRLIKKDSINFGSNKNVTESMKSLDIGRTLSAAELLLTANFLTNVNRVKAYGRKEKPDEADDSLTDMFEGLSPLTQISEGITRCIISEDEIADDASPNLRKIRREISSTNDKIHSQLISMLNGSYRSYLQDAVITMRDNRYCIPVKAEYKSQVSGMIHDQSSTGSTVFIEPAVVVNLNNRIRELSIEEQKEIEVILADLSAKVGIYSADIIEDQKIMTKLDFIFAKGRLAIEMNATRPVFNDEHVINIRKARHPLLDPRKVVPIDIRLGEDFDLLIVTGPNTGGKTVSLKTVGLLTLMGQSGLHIPAGDRSRLGIFKKVYADIGDEQSIEQSLSTFSAHMKNIVAILKHADNDSLCLFDELGAGTDPTEGAALAIAILNHLHDRGIRTMATTHYSELKVYALSTSFVENACCEFDVDSLSPTYRLLIGIPGKSNAFAISKRLGLKDHIIEAAKQQIEKDKESFEGVKKAKGQLYDYIKDHGKAVFLNMDDPDLTGMAKERGLETIGYGPDFWRTIVLPSDSAHPFLRMAVPDNVGKPETEDENLMAVETRLVGSYNAVNVLAAVAVGLHFGVSLDDALQAVADYVPANNRSMMVRTERNSVIVDAYNANPTSMAAALENFANVSEGQKLALLGSMGELGADSVDEHRAIVRRLGGISRVCLVGEEFRKALELEGTPENVRWYASSEDLAAAIKAEPVSGYTVLLKGSRSQQMEKVLPNL